jgi:thiol-disulfide isomerase/thioredoxin
MIYLTKNHKNKIENTTENTTKNEVQNNEQENQDTQKELSDKSNYLPSLVKYGQKLPVTEFSDGQGGKKDLTEYEGKPLVIIYWASWCKYCDELLGYSTEIEDVAEKQDANILLIDKLEPEKDETVDKAEKALKDKNISFDCVYDENKNAFEQYGIQRIPAVIILDKDGYVRYMAARVIDGGDELEKILEQVKQTGDSIGKSFLDKNMIGKDGGIYTNYKDKSSESPSGHDVLSESQGLIMEYAVLTDNPDLFAQSFSFVQENMKNQDVFSWYVKEEGNQAGANALLDDLRIFKALSMAQEKWGSYNREKEELSDAILAHNIYKKNLTGFYDFEQKKAGTNISLCYADFQTLNLMSEENSKYTKLVKNLKTVVENGYISDDFPLYYSNYNYEKKVYSKDSLHTAEALMTLYHLAQNGMLKDTSKDWVMERLQEGTIAARYNVDGTVTEGYNYDSTAVYAIAALIGYETDDAEIYTKALNKMEQARNIDTDSVFYGGFTSTEDGSDIIAFDQLMPMIVYAYTSDKIFIK